MATANEQIVLCNECGKQLNPDKSSEHSQCTFCTRRRAEAGKKRNSSETIAEHIPCEYCTANININEWQSHVDECTRAHQRRIERLQNSTTNIEDDEESTPTFIPCENCQEEVLFTNWNKHSKQCTHVIHNPTNMIDDQTSDIIHSLIPCEYCNELVTTLDLSSHTEQCAELERQRITAIYRQNESDPLHNLIPCQYCNKPFSLGSIENHQTECQRLLYSGDSQSDRFAGVSFAGMHAYPDTWDQSTPHNLSRFTLDVNSDEYKFVADKFKKTLATNQIIKIERIQNRRWYRQYDAHRDDFIERYSRSTETWLFHGCQTMATAEAIMKDCFNRSHAVRCAAGQGIYFAEAARTSLGYTQPDEQQHRHMFMARVLVGQTTGGDQTTRVCPQGFDTTGGGGVYVTYHDAQAYGEYLIVFH